MQTVTTPTNPTEPLSDARLAGFLREIANRAWLLSSFSRKILRDSAARLNERP